MTRIYNNTVLSPVTTGLYMSKNFIVGIFSKSDSISIILLYFDEIIDFIEVILDF